MEKIENPPAAFFASPSDPAGINCHHKSGFCLFLRHFYASTYTTYVVHVFGAWWSRLHTVYDRPYLGNLWRSQCSHPSDAPGKTHPTLRPKNCVNFQLPGISCITCLLPTGRPSGSANGRRRLASVDCYYRSSCHGFTKILLLWWVEFFIDGRQYIQYFSPGALQILITDSAPCQSALGSVSGLAQALGCVAKSLAPSVTSSLFAVSLQRNWAGGNAVYYILMGIVTCGIRFSFMLPKALQLQRNPCFEDDTSPRDY